MQIYTSCTCSTYGDQKKAELEKQAFVSLHVDVGNPTQVPWKSNQ